MTTRVLIVEENKDLIESLSRHLQSCGFQVAAAQNGTEAMALALSEHPDVILVGLAEGADANALAQMRAHAQTRGIPILALAAEYFRASGRPSLQSAPAPKARLLLVEDHQDLLDLLSRQLQFFGFQVATARDGAEAVAMAGSERPDLILMDVVMPKMDGCEALSRIRANPDTCQIPVLALTAWLCPTSQKRFLAQGFDAYIAKPFKQDDLLRAIEKVFSGDGRRTDGRVFHPLPRLTGKSGAREMF